MQSLRIQGLLRVANRVRGELSQPTSAARQQELRQLVADSLRQVDRIIAAHGTRLENLPAPTQRAYRFLVELDFDAPRRPEPPDHTAADPSPRGNVSLVGLTSSWQSVLDRLARTATIGVDPDLYESLQAASQKTERYLQDEGLGTRDLTPQCRTIRSWLAFFAERENFDTYVAAVQRAKSILSAALEAAPRFRPPLFVHFRPISGLFRVRSGRDGTRVILPTPMITFGEELFAHLAAMIFEGRRTKRAVLIAIAGEAYQDVAAELDALTGMPERTRGVYHDLAAAFERVRQAYFDGTVSRPRLTWSRTFTGRKFGHYDPITDTVMISSSFDRGDVPAAALDFVMYHELLHKQLGVSWQAGRAMAHTPKFRAAEQRFTQHDEANTILKRLAFGL